MDFMKLLRSFEDFLFEAATWLIFYPLILWRILTRPLRTMAYSDAQQASSEERRYDDAISPPLVLVLTVVLLNVAGAALHSDAPKATSALGKALFGSPETLALVRSLVFSLAPLVAAATLLRRKGVHLSRETLRGPFYAQCYLAAPCAIMVSAGLAIFRRPDISDLAGAALVLVGTGWFVVTQTRWFARKLEISWPRALGVAVWALVEAWAYLLALLIPLALALNAGARP